MSDRLTPAFFGHTPANGKHTFAIQTDQERCFLVGEAICLEDAARALLTEAVGNDGMDARNAFLCHFALDAAAALREAAGQDK